MLSSNTASSAHRRSLGSDGRPANRSSTLPTMVFCSLLSSTPLAVLMLVFSMLRSAGGHCASTAVQRDGKATEAVELVCDMFAWSRTLAETAARLGREDSLPLSVEDDMLREALPTARMRGKALAVRVEVRVEVRRAVAMVFVVTREGM